MPLRCCTVAVLLLVTACSGSSPHRQASSRRLVYAVVDLTQGGRTTTSQVIDIASPERARSVIKSASGGSLGGVAWNESEQLLVGQDGTYSVVTAVPPQFAGAAWALGVSVPFALAHGRAASRGSSTVHGRTCDLVRTLEPVDVGELAPATSASVADSCITADGTLLQETWSLKGEVVRTRTLVSDTAGPSLAGAGLYSGQRPKPAPSSTGGQQVKDEPVAVLVKALGIPAPSAPLGLPPSRSAATISLDPQGTGVSVEGSAFSWTDGRRLVVLQVDRGLTTRLPVGSEGVPVQVGTRTVGVQALAVGLRARFAGPEGLVASVTGNVPVADLLAWLATVSLG